MLTLKKYAHEMVKQSNAKVRFADSLIGRGLKGASSTTKSAVARLKEIIKKKKSSPKEQEKALKAFMDSPAGAVLKETGAAAVGAGKLVGGIFTRKAPGGKRKLDIMKGAVTLSIPTGMYYGMKRGRMKVKQSKYYGQRKPPSVYADPRRRLY